MPLALLLFFAGAPGDLESAIRAFSQVYAAVEQNAADPVDPNRALYEGALPGLLRKLDPHSVFFSPGQFDQLKELQTSTSKGFGTVVSVLPGRVIILQTVEGTPAARSGLQPGDEIVAINGIRLDWLDMEQLAGLLGESRRRPAKLDVRRPGTRYLLQFTLTPEALASPSVDRAYMLEPRIGYVRATSFEVETGKQIKEAIEKLGGASLLGLVLDLRGNPGGVLTAGLETAALFLPPGKKLLSIRGRARQAEETSVPERGTPYNFPLAILINGKSASASEIVAGGMQDHDRAVIIGETSFGKGLVQSVYPLSQGTGMALTTAFYFTPSGRSIQKPLSGGQLIGTPLWRSLETQAEFRTESGRLVRGGGGIIPDHLVGTEAMTRLRAALDASGSITSFATSAIKTLPPVTAAFEVNDTLLESLRSFLSENRILPGVSEWSADREWTRSRLRQEIFNQTIGVEKGDEVESRRDPQIRKAVDLLGAAR
ncbi:MAG: PDZ domain-containing protein [Acidobacteriia bacterium]|nr:PDZ domain-containing protein [Terriglobia bacterium]